MTTPDNDKAQAQSIARLTNALSLLAQGFILPFATTADLAQKLSHAAMHARHSLEASSWVGAGPRNAAAIDAGIELLETELAALKKLRGLP